jgi:hypothetical protein
VPLLQVRKAAAGKAGGKKRGTSTLLVDDLDNLQIRSRTYRWGGVVWCGGAPGLHLADSVRLQPAWHWMLACLHAAPCLLAWWL